MCICRIFMVILCRFVSAVNEYKDAKMLKLERTQFHTHTCQCSPGHQHLTVGTSSYFVRIASRLFRRDGSGSNTSQDVQFSLSM